MKGYYIVRASSNGGDRRHGRSLAETLEAGRRLLEPDSVITGTDYYDTDDASYNEASGPKNPKDNTRRPVEGEWDPYDIYDAYNEHRGFNK